MTSPDRAVESLPRTPASTHADEGTNGNHATIDTTGNRPIDIVVARPMWKLQKSTTAAMRKTPLATGTNASHGPSHSMASVVYVSGTSRFGCPRSHSPKDVTHMSRCS